MFLQVLGKDLRNRMPLSVPVSKKLAPKDIMGHMRDHYTGTALDMSKDIGAQAWANKVRDRPLTWQ